MALGSSLFAWPWSHQLSPLTAVWKVTWISITWAVFLRTAPSFQGCTPAPMEEFAGKGRDGPHRPEGSVGSEQGRVPLRRGACLPGEAGGWGCSAGCGSLLRQPALGSRVLRRGALVPDSGTFAEPTDLLQQWFAEWLWAATQLLHSAAFV